MVEKNQTLRWTSAVVENFLFCGFLLGWHMLQNVFVDEGFFCNAEGQLREVKILNFFRGKFWKSRGQNTQVQNISTNASANDCDKEFQGRQLTGKGLMIRLLS